jgi:uncharacterized damage-inducible protein DinB
VIAHPTQSRTRPGPAAVRIFSASERVNQLILQHLAPVVWKAKTPGNVRTIAAIFTHMHNVRTKWIRLNAPHLPVPPQLNRSTCTQRQARAALAQSAKLCARLLSESLQEDGRTFLRDGWARPLPAGPEMLCYMLSHEAHHRGQVCMLAHQLGSPLPAAVTSALWNWEKLIDL